MQKSNKLPQLYYYSSGLFQNGQDGLLGENHRVKYKHETLETFLALLKVQRELILSLRQI